MKQFEKILIGLVIFCVLAVLVGNCNSKSRDLDLEDRVARQDSIINILLERPESVTSDQVRKISEEESSKAMYQFLIYEDDLDKGKISLSQIRENLKEGE